MTETSVEARVSEARPTPADLVMFIPYACVQLQAPFSVSVLKIVQDEYVSKTEEKSKKSAKGKSAISHQTSHAQHDSQEKEDESMTTGGALFGDPNEVVVTVVFDLGGRLVELQFNKTPAVPRLLIKIIALCIPYQTCLSRITMRWVPLKGEIIYEMAKFLPQSHVTEVLLENTHVPQHNYYQLFEFAHLRRVSLIRCALTDDDCVCIAVKLVHPQPASKTLTLLSLASNQISDKGACALAEALRSNRMLQYLNLSGNRINDDGATSILQSLMQFALTYDELLTKRERMMEHMRLKQEVFQRFVRELSAAMKEKSPDDGSRSVRRKTATGRSKKTSTTCIPLGVYHTSIMDAITMKADTMASELVGTLSDPFNVDETDTRDRQVFSLGNTVLCYLNLSFNNLGYETVAALVRVLSYQQRTVRKSGPGILRIVIEGNRMPASCSEYSIIDELLEQAMAARMSKPPRRVERGKSRIK
ncbi:uncharacterized protein LOC115450731 [Manduca sexta]|uniref:uncharacterized protein LOC115450731 n=1 Tax=Manduca sexta TaxID=7130 RepID=UPI00118404B7|nr:uncharacterized protein LOC115450731 [Manduca sexta]